MATRRLQVEIVGDSRSLDRALGRSQKNLGGFGKAAKTAARSGAVIATGMGTAATAAIKLASDAEETASKFRIVFGKSARQATRELDAFSKASGTSRFALRDQAAGFQALIRPMGVSVQNAGKMSVGLTKLATDLASFNNTSVEDAMVALKSGLVGESEPLRRYGVQLSAARIQAFAYAKGIAQTGKDLTSAQKAQASYGLILQDTKLAQGDAVRTSGSFANQFKRLKATVTDVATELGVKLLPAARNVVAGITSFITQMRTGTGAGGQFRNAMANIGGVLGPIVGVIANVAASIGRIGMAVAQSRPAIGALVGGLVGLGVALAVGKVVAFISALGGLRAAIAATQAALMRTGWGAAIVAIGAVAGALFGMRSATNAAKVSSNDLADALRRQADAARAVRDVDLEVAQRKANVRSANVALAQAEQRVNALRRAGKGNTLEGKQAEADLAQARVQSKRASRDLGDAEVDTRRKRQDHTRAIREGNAARRGSIERIKGEIRELLKDGVTKGFTRERTEALRKKQRELRIEIGRLRSKEVNVKLNMSVKELTRKYNPFVGGGSGDGWGVDRAIQNTSQQYVDRNPSLFQDLFNQDVSLGGKGVRGSGLNAFNRFAGRFGVRVGDGLRPPGTRTSSGNVSLHSLGRARDFPGPPAGMMAFAKFLVANFGSKLTELIYTPLGFSIKHGKRVAPYAQADHYDHVHVGLRHGGRTSQRVTKPTVHMAEEAPRHPEYYISTNPRDKARSQGLLAQAAQEIGLRHGGRIGGIPGVFARQIRRMGIRGRQARVMFEAMLRANAVEGGGLGNNPRHGDRDSLGVFQIRGMHGSARNRMDPAWSARWFANTARSAWRKGMGAAELAAAVERPAAQYRFKYGSSRYVPEGRVRGLVDAFSHGAGRSGRGRRGRRRRPEKPTKGTRRLGYADQVTMADLGIARAEGTAGRGDDRAAIGVKSRLLAARTTKVQKRLTKINRALKGKLRRGTRRRLLGERSRLLQEMVSLTTDRGALSGQLAELNAPAEVASAGDAGSPDTSALQANTEALQAAAQAQREHAEQLKGLKDEMAKNNATANSIQSIGLREAQKALADMISGQLGGMATQRTQTASSGALMRL